MSTRGSGGRLGALVLAGLVLVGASGCPWQIQRQRMQAMAEKDFVTLNAVLADDLIYTHSSARLDTKKSLIGNMQSGATVYTSVEPADVKAQDLGDAVVLTGSAQIKVVSNGNPNAFGVRFTDVYAKRNGRWQMVTWQSTRLPA